MAVFVGALWAREDRQCRFEISRVPDSTIAIDQTPPNAPGIKRFQLSPGDHALLGDNVGEPVENQLPEL